MTRDLILLGLAVWYLEGRKNPDAFSRTLISALRTQLAKNKELLAISKSTKESLAAFKRGVHLERTTRKSIDDLTRQACIDRLRLSRLFLRAAKRALGAKPSQCRQSISRGYYSMYHAVRATVYHSFGGDDHQDHSEVARHLPGDFPNRVDWENEFKEARLRRNEADYDPYPLSDEGFRKVAKETVIKAIELHKVVLTYLGSRGISI